MMTNEELLGSFQFASHQVEECRIEEEDFKVIEAQVLSRMQTPEQLAEYEELKASPYRVIDWEEGGVLVLPSNSHDGENAKWYRVVNERQQAAYRGLVDFALELKNMLPPYHTELLLDALAKVEEAEKQ